MRCAFVTTSRADFGLLRWPIHAAAASPRLDVLIIAGGTHFSSHHGMTKHEIEAEGFQIAGQVEHLVEGTSDIAVATSMGRATIGFARQFEALSPDLAIVLGDRYEVFAAVSAATVMRIPVAHLCGGDVTEGAYDEAFRHGISKAAALHFPTHAAAARRLAQMGEPADRIHLVGSTGLDALHHIAWKDRDAVFQELNLAPRKHNVIVTLHPPTRIPGAAQIEIRAMVDALASFGDELGIVFTGINADSEADLVAAEIEPFAKGRANVRLTKSLGQTGYLNAVRQMDAVVGNSSSGLYEAPSLKVPTVNIGDRQSGRPKASSVIDTPGSAVAIRSAIEAAFQLDCSATVNPYGDGHSSERIVRVLEQISNPRELVRKTFVDLPNPWTDHQ